MWKALCLIVCVGAVAACGTNMSPAVATPRPTASPSPAPPQESFYTQLINGDPGWSYDAIKTVSHDPTAIAQFIAVVKSLPVVTTPVACPFDNAYHLHLLDIDATGQEVFGGDVLISGCQFLVFEFPQNAHSYWTNQHFWDDLSALAGQSLPSDGMSSVTPTPSSATSCPAPWETFPDYSMSIIGDTVPLPPLTRVVMVNSAPGAASATLCTQGSTPAAINAFLIQQLPQHGWHEVGATTHWTMGTVLEVDWSVSNPMQWQITCTCGGIA